jgi:hypothetical protein
MTTDERFSASFEELRPDRMVGARHEAITGPVRSWETDFSHVEPEWADDPYRVYDDLRQRCPIAHTDRFGGGWLPPVRRRRGHRLRHDSFSRARWS